MTRPAPASLLLYGDPEYQHPDAEDVDAVLKMLKARRLPLRVVATLLGYASDRTVRRWIAPADAKYRAPIEYAAWRLLLQYAGLAGLAKLPKPERKSLRKNKTNRAQSPKIESLGEG